MTRSFTWVSVPLIAAAIALWQVLSPTPGAAAATSVIDPLATPTVAHGSNLLVRSAEDTSFCLEVQGGTTAGRTVSLQQCSNADAQRWAFTWNDDGSNSIVDIQGMCLDARLRSTRNGQQASVQNCRFGDAWQYVVTSEGLIQDVRSGQCLAVPGAAANAAAVFVTCDGTRDTQLWRLTR